MAIGLFNNAGGARLPYNKYQVPPRPGCLWVMRIKAVAHASSILSKCSNHPGSTSQSAKPVIWCGSSNITRVSFYYFFVVLSFCKPKILFTSAARVDSQKQKVLRRTRQLIGCADAVEAGTISWRQLIHLTSGTLPWPLKMLHQPGCHSQQMRFYRS